MNRKKSMLLILFSVVYASLLASSENDELFFMENKGQYVDNRGVPTDYVVAGMKSSGFKLLIGKNSLHYIFGKYEEEMVMDEHGETRKTSVLAGYQKTDVYLKGANPKPEVVLNEPTQYYENMYGKQYPGGITNIGSYKKVTIKEVYPHIDWVIYLQDNRVKYDFIVHRGGNPQNIVLAYSGMDDVIIEGTGDLSITNALGSIREKQPYVWQEVYDNEIKSSYQLNEDSTVSFKIAGYDRNKKLVIDPEVEWATYYGNGDGAGMATTTDDEDNVFLAGTTSSFDWIAYNGHQNDPPNGLSYGVSYTGFLVKFNKDGERLWGTYYDGFAGYSAWISEIGLATDSENNIFMGGKVVNHNGFETYNGHQEDYGGGDATTPDGGLVKFDSNGIRQWATFYGGGNDDWIETLAVDSEDNVYVAGTTSSNSNIAYNGHQNQPGGLSDGFLVKFDSEGNRLWATYYGGSWRENAFDVAIDNENNVYIAGSTASSNNIYYQGFQEQNNGEYDGFLVKFTEDGVRLWATYYGGEADDFAYGVVTDSQDNVYICGRTQSYEHIAYQGYQNEWSQGFLVKFNSYGNRVWGTYNVAPLFNLAIDKESDYIFSTNFFAANIHKFNTHGILQWKYLYTVSDINKIALDSEGSIYVAGAIFPPNGPLEGIENGHQDELIEPLNNPFLAKFSQCSIENPPLFEVSGSTAYCEGGEVTLSIGSSDSTLWNTGDASTNITVSEEGMYSVSSYIDGCVVVEGVYVENFPVYNFTTDTLLCYHDSLMLPDSTVTSEEGFYVFEYLSQNGCDSIYEVDIALHPKPNPTVIFDNESTIETQDFDSYRWLYYGNPIPGATAQSYELLENGEYRVAISDMYACRDTSETFTIMNLSLNSHQNTQVNYYPNPATERLFIELENVTENIAVSVLSIDGKVLLSHRCSNDLCEVDLGGLSSGMYILSISDGNHIRNGRFFKE